MIWKLVEAIACIIECIILSNFIIHYFPCKNNRSKITIYISLFGFLTIVDLLGTFWFNVDWIFAAGMIGSCLIISILFLNGRIVEKILISIIGFLLFYFINLPVLYLLGFLSGSSPTEIAFAKDVRRIVCLLTTKLLYFALTRFILKLRKKETYRFSRYEWFIIISSLCSTLLIGIAMNTVVTKNYLSNYVMMGTVILLSVLDLIIFQFMRRLSKANQQEIEHKMLKVQLNSQQEDMRKAELQYKRISIIQHDYQNQLDCIHSLMCNNQIQRAIQYVEEISQKHSTLIQSHIHCSSSVVNAVINEKISIAQNENISCTCQIIVPIPGYLEYDLSVLLANVLDNAIDACRKEQEEPRIVLTISDVAAYYRINIKNTISESVLQKNSSLKTSKEHPENHGWGLQSVKEIANSHNGSIDIYEKDNMFVVNILLMKEE